jgi:undecaprenyl-diphosphatase
MNEYLLSVLLGVIEGLTEFLPVSSTAHLRIFEALVGVDLSNGYWKMFTIVIQLGAILCLPIYFWDRILKFVRTFPHGELGEKNIITHPLTLTAAAFVCTAVPALLLTKIIGKHLESLVIMGTALLVGGVIMWAVDWYFGKPRIVRKDHPGFPTERVEEMGFGQAIWIGICQIASAVFPGTSRSMSTIAAGQVAGMSRPAALEFSFFLSIPTMVAATGYDLYKSLRPGGANPIGAMHIDPHGWELLIIGFVISFVVAYGVVAWFMHWVRTRGFAPFAVYRIVVGVAVLWWAVRG